MRQHRAVNERRRPHAARPRASDPGTPDRSCPTPRAAQLHRSNRGLVPAPSPHRRAVAGRFGRRRRPSDRQLRRQQLAPAVQPRSHRAHRAGQRLRRLRVTELLQVAQHHDLAVPHRQRSAPRAGRARSPRRGSGRPAGPRHRRSSSIALLVHVLERLERTLAPEPLARAVPGNPTQPGRHPRSTGLVSRRRPHHHHEHVLRHVVGRRRRAGHVQREAVDLPLTPPEQSRERLRVALRRPARSGRHPRPDRSVARMVMC